MHSGVSPQYLMHALDRRPAFPDRGSAAFHGAGTDIARCENSREACLERAGRAILAGDLPEGAAVRVDAPDGELKVETVAPVKA